MSSLPATLTPILEETSTTDTDRKIEIKFGGGYVQRAGDGINPLEKSVNVAFVGSKVNIKTYTDFFNDLKGYQTFSWQHPDETSETDWVCGPRTVSYLADGTRKLVTTFIRDYGLAD